jgi:hypothetical protein
MKQIPMTIDTPAPNQPQPNVALPRNRLIMTIGDKGGTGKSFFTHALAGIHLADGTNDLLLIDGDSTVGTLVKFFGDRLVNHLLRQDAKLVIVDLPATSLTRLREISADYDFVAAAKAAGYRLTVISPITPYDDPILDLQETITLFDPELSATFDRLETAGGGADFEVDMVMKPEARVDYVAAVNLGLGEDRTDFALWDEHDTYTRRLFEFVGGFQLELPAMRPRIAALLQKHRLSFADGEVSDHLSVTDRGRLQRWNAAAMQSLRGAGGRLGF